MNRLVEWTLLAVLCLGPTAGVAAEESPLPQAWDYAAAMRAVARRGRPARRGPPRRRLDHLRQPLRPVGPGRRGPADDDRAALDWMHAGADDDTDGWWLARADHPDGGRSYTACGGIRADEMLAGGKSGCRRSRRLLDQYRPQVVVLMLGTNDASAGRDVAAYRADMEAAVDLMLGPRRRPDPVHDPAAPGPRRSWRGSYNEALRSLARTGSCR